MIPTRVGAAWVTSASPCNRGGRSWIPCSRACAMRARGSPDLYEYMVHPIGPVSDHDGGQLIYFIDTPYGFHPVECQLGLLDADPA